MSQLVWFRNDLRVHDNPALFHACRQPNQVIGLACLTQEQWHKHGLGERKWQLLINSLHELRSSLESLNIPLLVINSSTFANSVEEIKQLITYFNKHQVAIDSVHFNIEYEVNERKRDIELQRWCRSNNIEVYKFHDQCVIPPGEVTTKQDLPFKVYTPFKKAWWQRFEQYQHAPLSKPKQRSAIVPELKKLLAFSQQLPAQVKDDLWPCSEHQGHQRLQDFLDQNACYYADERDFPAKPSTSQLSYALSLGLLSPRQCLYSVWQKNGCALSGGHPGLDSWINELIWREFYRHLLVAFPQLCKHKAFKPETENVAWRTGKAADADFKAWCEGNTGYPIVDAAQRQLIQTGWMHNRLRMISAMFLTKHLLIDWRWGEAHYNQYLVDADLASNNGGWQWSASTGADGAPYFRIFNPTTQSQRFDPNGEFISHFVPELNTLAARDRHQPTDFQRQQTGYVSAIVEHKFARQRALDAFKQSSQQAHDQASLIE